MRKSLLKVSAFVVACATALSASAYSFVKDGIYYNILTDGNSVEVTYKSTTYNSYSGSVTVPDSVEYDGKTYPVTVLGKYCFRKSTGMTALTIPNTVTEIVSGAMSQTGLSTLTIPGSVKTIGSLAIQDNPNLKELIFNEGLESVAASAFMGDVALEKVTLPSSLKTLDGSAFKNCTTLVAIHIPENVTKLGNNVFQGCTGLKNITVAANNPNYADIDGILTTKSKKTLLAYPGGRTDATVVIPECVDTLDFASLQQRYISVTTKLVGNTDYKKVVFPSTLTVLYNSALSDLESVESYELPAALTYIGNGTFRNSLSLTSIDIPDNVKFIDQAAFTGCTKLATVTIGTGIANIAKTAFAKCTALKSITIKATTPPATTGDVVDATAYAGLTLYVPSEAVEAYKADAVWGKFGQILAIGTTGIDSVATETTAEAVAIYDARGIAIPSLRHGLNIVKMTDGSTRKIIVR